MATEELVRKLFEAVKSLKDASLVSEEILKHLETVERLLAQIEQTPPEPLKDSLSLLMNVLLSKNMAGNENMDIKASAVFSISEILRIVAPDAPYSDDQMKEMFLATIPVLDQLALNGGHAYNRALYVLDVMAKIRTVLILLDLEFEHGDALVIQLFQQFFKNIRSDHPTKVFPCMESIMTLVLEDTDAISPDLLSILLSSVRKENRVSSPTAFKLGEKVCTVCAKKLQKHIAEAVKKGTINVDEYAEIVKTIYQKEINRAELSSKNDVPKQNLEKNEPAQKDGQVEAISNDAGKKVVSESLQPDGPTSGLLVPQVIQPFSLEEEKSMGEQNPAKQSSPLNEEDEGNLKRARSIPTDQEISETEAEDGSRRITVTLRPLKNDCIKSRGVKRRSSPVIPEQGSSKRANTKVAASGSESRDESNSLIDTWISHRSRTVGLRKPVEKRKVKFLLFGRDLYESKDQQRDRKKRNVSRSIQEIEIKEKTSKTSSGHGTLEIGGTGEKRSKEVVLAVPEGAIEANSDVNSEAEGVVMNSSGPRRGTRMRQDSKKKILSSEWRAKSSKRNVSSVPVPERKLETENDVASESAEVGKGLVGKTIKVWWPLDEEFYEGVVSSYDAAKKKHVVSYADGDREELNLKEERWGLVESDVESAEGGSTDLEKLEDSMPIIGLLKKDKLKKLAWKHANKEKKAKSVQEKNAKTNSSSSKQSAEEKQIETEASPEKVEKRDNETSPEPAAGTESEYGTEECANKLIALSKGAVKNKKLKPISELEKKKK